MSREAMQMALEALELYQSKSSVQMFDDAVKALRQALETEQEPVATVTSESGNPNLSMSWWHEPALPVGTKIYTSPPKREWVGLTDEEIDALSQAPSLTDELMDCVDRLGSEADTVDPRVWQHLLVYAPKPEEEPVAWMHTFIEGNVITHIPADIGRHPERWTPLYTAPLKKEWVGLTDKEIQDLGYLSEKFDASNSEWFDRWGFARAIEQSLREKNHG